MSWQYGKVVYPIPPPAVGGSLLANCDPAIAKILDFLAYMIRTYAGDAIQRATDVSEAPIGEAIALVAPVDPDYIAKSEQWQFPLLCAWRKSAVYAEKTNNWANDVCKVGLAYILPPLSAAQLIRFHPYLTSVGQVVNYALNTGHDAGYRSDERIVRDNNIAKVRLMSADFGAYKFSGEDKAPLFPSWLGEVELTEQVVPYTIGLPDLTGTDFTVTHQAKDDLATAIAADAAISDTTITVASSTGFAALDVVEIGHFTARAETVVVLSIPDATHLVIGSPGLTFAHTAAQADVVQRSPVTIVQAASEVGP